MTDTPNEVPAFEHGRLRLYALDSDSPDGRALIDAHRAEPRDAGAAMQALGAERVDPYWLDLVKLRDIAEIGLKGYLKQGYDVPADQLDTADLSTTAGHVLIVPSRAFSDEAQSLTPVAALMPLASFDLGVDVGALRPITPVETAPPDRPPSEQPAGPPAGRGLRAGGILILLLIAAAFVALVVL